ncbi:MAG: hypothetical protein Q9218_002691 [Villophora microphyllina]
MSFLPRRLSPPRRASSTSAAHNQNMAYPFPRFASAPQTPQYLKGIESPSSAESRGLDKPKPRLARGILVFFGAVLIILILWARSVLYEPHQTDRVPFSQADVDDFFNHFEGHQDCGISSTDIYLPPPSHLASAKKHSLFCPDRASLLQAMSGGGRHGFDTPYFPASCHFRWYSTSEICMILDRFDEIVFLGDDTLRHVYSAFNMLLRENIALGGLRQWDMKESEREICRCENQLIRPECLLHAVTDSQQVRSNDAGSGHSSPYLCDPTSSMDEWVTLADISQRNVPFLWVGPNAAGHLKPPSQILIQGNNALWHYTIEMAKEAEARELDALGMYNLTLQAGSWDGSFYGQKVVLVQAMMIINWLSRLETT